MKVYSHSPKDWKDLQNNVAKLLSEIGYDTEVEKNIQTIRETINIDVYAIDIKKIPQSTILCECKHWNNPVPKTIVHAFRTTVSDYGANHGIIISKAGFQSGTYEAVKNTNIMLFDWEHFQEYFKIRWVQNRQLTISKITKPLYNYVSVVIQTFFKEQYNRLSENQIQIFKNLSQKYFSIAFNSSNLDYKNLESNEFDIQYFEIYLKEIEIQYGQTFNAYEEYFNFLLKKAKEGIDEFDSLFEEKLRLSNTYEKVKY